MSSQSQARPLIYHYIRRGYWSQIVSLCDPQSSTKKGGTGALGASQQTKDPALAFWKAFALVRLDSDSDNFSHSRDHSIPRPTHFSLSLPTQGMDASKESRAQSLSELEGLQSRRDMQLPVNYALVSRQWAVGSPN